ncbi:MAG: hypothetical protein IPJ06_05075 [Saprospiraceae bacterium]|nr:hypothetical protein [Saprospiraceae bacterium]
MTALEVLLEILKLTIPGLVVFATVYILLKQLTAQLLVNRQMDQRIDAQKISIPHRLQAYERLSLYCERISIPNLILRLRHDNMTVNSLKWAMMQAIQQEYEHNVTQQVYVSESLWTILRLAREHMMTILDATAQSLDKTATADQYIQALFEHLEKQENDPLLTALSAIKKEAALRL